MIELSRRPLTTSEIDDLQRTCQGRGAGCTSNLAFYGGLLIFVPAVGGGLLGVILAAAGVPRDMAYSAGLGIVFLASAAFLIWILRAEGYHWKYMRRMAREDIAAGVVEILTFDVRRAWEVDDLNDLGPGYLFETLGDDFVYAATQYFLDFDQSTYPSTRISVERLPVSKSIIGVKHEGQFVAPESEALSIDELRIMVECEVLTLSDIPEPVRAKLGIT
jgi:hypothetical protein